jgi:tRNA G46 methylase TrmB
MPTEDRTRSLEHIEEMLQASGGIEAAVLEQLERRSPIDVLEVGFGHGRALLELAWRLRDRDVAFHGVDIGYKSQIAERARTCARWRARSTSSPRCRSTRSSCR